MEINDEERRRVAQRMRNEIHFMRLNRERYESEDDVVECGNRAFRDIANAVIPYSCLGNDCIGVVERLADLIEPQLIDGETSDGYHTFNELYHHRAVLFSVIVSSFSDRAWKSKLHADGTMYDGMFIVGIKTPDGQATYHYDVEPYWDMFHCKEVDRAPEWDGHTPDQAIERIGKLAEKKKA